MHEKESEAARCALCSSKQNIRIYSNYEGTHCYVCRACENKEAEHDLSETRDQPRPPA